MPKRIDWEAIRQDHRIVKYPSIRALAKAYSITHPAILKKIKEKPKAWKQDLSKEVKRVLRAKIVTRKAKEIVTTLGTGNKKELEKKINELDDEVTVEYAALSDLAFINNWHERFLETLEAVTIMKKEIIENKRIRKDKNGKDVEEPIGLSVRSTVLNAITQAENRTYLNMRKNLNLDAEGEDPPDTELSEADKDDLKRMAIAAAKEEIKNG